MNYRSVLAIFLALVTALMLNLGSAEAAKKAKKPLSYTPEQLEQIQTYASDLQELRDRLPELAALITKKDWTFTRNFIHGPLGELRVVMVNASRNLLPDAQPGAQMQAKKVFDDLVAIDAAAQAAKYPVALSKYNAAIKDFDAFLSLLPKG